MVMHVEQPSAFDCLKCGFKTSGIIQPGGSRERRWCPDCNSPLFRCSHCNKSISGTINGATCCGHCSKFSFGATDGSDVVLCDHCKKVATPAFLIVKF